jgi:hypothetical protein
MNAPTFVTLPRNHIAALRNAIKADVAGIVNVEGRSELDFLITELQSLQQEARGEWADAILDLLVRSENALPEGSGF